MPAAPTFTLGDYMRKAREASKISVEVMASELRVSRNTVTNYEHDRSRPNRATLVMWANLTNVPVEWFDAVTGGYLDSPDQPFYPVAAGF